MIYQFKNQDFPIHLPKPRPTISLSLGPKNNASLFYYYLFDLSWRTKADKRQWITRIIFQQFYNQCVIGPLGGSRWSIDQRNSWWSTEPDQQRAFGCHLCFSISADHDRFVPAHKTQSKIYVVENCKAINYSGGINWLARCNSINEAINEHTGGGGGRGRVNEEWQIFWNELFSRVPVINIGWPFIRLYIFVYNQFQSTV